jgi:hypothetical protein
MARVLADEPRPPIVYVDEGGGVDTLFSSVADLLEYLEWPVQYDGDPAEAYDALGRRVVISCRSEQGPIDVTVSREAHPQKLAEMLRAVARRQPVRYGLIDADVDLDVLLRALWPTWRYAKRPYPDEQ